MANRVLIWLLVLIIALIAYAYGIAPLLFATTLPAIVKLLIQCVLVMVFCWWSYGYLVKGQPPP